MFIMIAGIYTVGIFLEDGVLTHVSALAWCLFTVILIMLGKFIHPTIELSHKKTTDEEVQRSIFDFDVLKLTIIGWLFLYSCVVFQALSITLVLSTLPESIQENTKLIGTLILSLVFAYAYFLKKFFVKKGINLLSS